MENKRVTPVSPSPSSKAMLDPKQAPRKVEDKPKITVVPPTRDKLSRLIGNLSRASEGKEEPQWHLVQDFLTEVDDINDNDKKEKNAILLERHDVTNANHRTLLHWVCMNQPPVGVVAAIVGLAPRTPLLPDDRFEGRTPLHMACQRGASLDVIQFLVRFGGGESAVLVQDNLGLTPLHLAASCKAASLEVIQFMVEMGGIDLLFTRTNSGFTALHKALVNHAPWEIIHHLVTQGGSGLLEFAMGHGSSPLHWACRSACPLRVMELLVEWGGDRSLLIADSMDGRTPLHWAARFHRTTAPGVIGFFIKKGGADLIMKKDNDDKFAADYVFGRQGADRVQAEFFKSTLQILEYHSTGVKPIPTETMLSIQSYTLHSLEKGMQQGQKLHETPLAHKSVQALWNNIFILRPTLMIVMMDMYAQILLFVSYHNATANRTEGQSNEFYQWQMVLLWIGTSWHLLREVLQLSTVSSRTWTSDAWNWIDILQIGLLLVSLRLFRQSGVLSPQHRAVFTITTGILRLAFLKILKNFFFSIAVFVYAIHSIVVELVPFLITSVVVLFAFVHMLRTAAIGTSICETEDADDLPAGCDTNWNTFKLFSSLFAMLIAELEVVVYEDSILVTLIFYGFAFVIGLLFLNVLIAKITNVFQRVEDEGRLVFFQSRVGAAVEIQTVLIAFGRIFRWGSWNDWEMDEWKQTSSSQRNIMLLYDRNTTEQIWKNSASRSEALCTTLFLYAVRLLIPVVLFGWFWLGLLSFGLLWPRWMKVYFFFEGQDDVKFDLGVVKTDIVKLQREWKRDLKEAQEHQMKLHSQLQDELTEIRQLLRANQ